MLTPVIAQSWWESMLPVAGILLIIASLFMALRKRRQRSGSRVTAREQLERVKQEKAVRGDLDQLMVELEQLARRFSAQLDAKSMHLEKLIDQADQRIAELQRLQEQGGKAGEGETGRAGDDKAEREASGGEQTEADPLRHSVYELADRGLSAMEIARQLDEHVGKIELILALRET